MPFFVGLFTEAKLMKCQSPLIRTTFFLMDPQSWDLILSPEKWARTSVWNVCLVWLFSGQYPDSYYDQHSWILYILNSGITNLWTALASYMINRSFLWCLWWSFKYRWIPGSTEKLVTSHLLPRTLKIKT